MERELCMPEVQMSADQRVLTSSAQDSTDSWDLEPYTTRTLGFEHEAWRLFAVQTLQFPALPSARTRMYMPSLQIMTFTM